MAFQSTLNKFGVPLVPGTNGIGILMPKLKYRFRVTMQNFGSSLPALSLTRQVESCGRPTINHNSTPLHSYNNIVYIPQKPEWQPIEIKVRDDITNSVAQLVGAQLQKQMNHFDQTSAVAGINFKFTTIIQVLDGGNTGVLENWYLEGCYLEQVQYDSNDYTSSDPVAITMTVRYDNATQDNTIMPQFQPPTGVGPFA
jgi:hypothetical protein